MVIYNKENNLFENVLAFLLSLPLGIWLAFVTSTLWLWLLVPAGLPEINIVHAYGLRLCAGQYLFYEEDENFKNKYLKKQLYSVVGSLFLLGLGAIARLFL